MSDISMGVTGTVAYFGSRYRQSYELASLSNFDIKEYTEYTESQMKDGICSELRKHIIDLELDPDTKQETYSAQVGFIAKPSAFKKALLKAFHEEYQRGFADGRK